MTEKRSREGDFSTALEMTKWALEMTGMLYYSPFKYLSQKALFSAWKCWPW